jgi:hypothetical protein
MKKLLGYQSWVYDPAVHGENDKWWKAAIYKHGVPAILVIGLAAGITTAIVSHF